MRRLARNVTIHVAGDPEPLSVGPGPVSDEIAALIEMPGVWADEYSSSAQAADLDEPGIDSGDDSVPSGPVERPTTRMGRPKWVAYAESIDLEVTDDMDKADIIAAVEALEAADGEDDAEFEIVEGDDGDGDPVDVDGDLDSGEDG